MPSLSPRHRQLDAERRALAWLTGDTYGAAMSLNDPLAQRQTQTGTHPGRFRRKERLKDALLQPGGMPGPLSATSRVNCVGRAESQS